MLPNSDKAILKFGKIFYIYKKLVLYLHETVTCITTKGKERKMPGKSVDIKLRKNNSVPAPYGAHTYLLDSVHRIGWATKAKL